MSTCNYANQEDFDLYVYAPHYSEQYLKEFHDEYGREMNEDDIMMDYDIESENFEWSLADGLKHYKKELLFFNVMLKSGYYEGMQIYIDEKEYRNPNYMDNDECHYYFGVCRSVALRWFEAEKNFINKKLLPYIAKQSSFEKIYCVGVFSNGEAVYKKAA